MTEARQKAEESRTLREIWKRFEGQTFSFGQTGMALCKAYEDAIRSRELELEKYRRTVPQIITALNRMLISFAGKEEELCMECGEKIGATAACESCYVISEAMKAIEAYKDWLPEAPREGQ